MRFIGLAAYTAYSIGMSSYVGPGHAIQEAYASWDTKNAIQECPMMYVKDTD